MSFEDKAMASRIISPSPKSAVSESDLRMINAASNVDRSQANSQANAVLGPVAIFWDIENCPVPSDVRPDDVAGYIRTAVRLHPFVKGAVTTLSAYGDFNAFPRRLREGCQRTGVKLVDVPNGRKDAADKAILVDMFLFALDNRPPSSIMLISGDVDFAPALHILGQRGYTIVLAIPSSVTVSSALSSAGSFVWDWPSLARGAGSVPPRSLGHRAPDPSFCSNSVTLGKYPEIQTEEEAIVYMGTSRNEYGGRTSNQTYCYNSSQMTGESCKAFCTVTDGNCGTNTSLRSYNDPGAAPFDICRVVSKCSVEVKPSLLDINREKRRAKELAKSANAMQYLRPGMVLLKNFLKPDDQVKIIRQCRELGVGTGGFYQPGYRDGAKLSLRMMCLGKNWDPDSCSYGDIRPFDGAQPPKIPEELAKFVNDAIEASHAFLKQSGQGTSKPSKEIPLMSPDICIANFYTTAVKLGLHQDKDEEKSSLTKGLPVVSFSLGDTAEFLYGDARDEAKASKIKLESGDVLIFGGQSRHIFHGVSRITEKTAPTYVTEEAKLRPGRLNLTFRQYQ